MLEEKLVSKVKALQAAERELDQQRKQHHVAMDKLLLQVQSLESALKAERHVVTEEKKKLSQLQHAYTCLFRDYDCKLKSEGGDLSSRLEEAERALAIKQDLIDKLKEEVEQQKGSLETVPVLTAQGRGRGSKMAFAPKVKKCNNSLDLWVPYDPMGSYADIIKTTPPENRKSLFFYWDRLLSGCLHLINLKLCQKTDN
ncbi:hypothetical protein AMECASPLE_033060 [Ameca splendens]|uniref:NF-kappa-B essential modulator NEMO CC2-LZ domain-containing protein n=1 Tax=Ameca splendens TaxID=208324 RepID=A0ABV0XVJ7_9TELE